MIALRSGVISGATIIGGSGKDTVEMLDPTTSASNVDVSLKGGADWMTVSAVAFSGGTFAGGAGGDTFALTGTAGAMNVHSW